jgi:hypothetical protein
VGQTGNYLSNSNPEQQHACKEIQNEQPVQSR